MWEVIANNFSWMYQSKPVGNCGASQLGSVPLGGGNVLTYTGPTSGAFSLGPDAPLQVEGPIPRSTEGVHKHGKVRAIFRPFQEPLENKAWRIGCITFAPAGMQPTMYLWLHWVYTAPMRRHTLRISHDWGGIAHQAELGVVSPFDDNTLDLDVYQDGCKGFVNGGVAVKLPVNITLTNLFPWQFTLYFEEIKIGWRKIALGTEAS